MGRSRLTTEQEASLELVQLTLQCIDVGYENIKILWESLLIETQRNLPAGDRVLRLVCRALFEQSNHGWRAEECHSSMVTIWEWEYRYAQKMLRKIDFELGRGRLDNASRRISRAVDIVKTAEIKMEMLMAFVKRLEYENIQEKAWKDDAYGNSDEKEIRRVRFQETLNIWDELYDDLSNGGLPHTFVVLEIRIEWLLMRQGGWRKAGVGNCFRLTHYLDLYGPGRPFNFMAACKWPPLFEKPGIEDVDWEIPRKFSTRTNSKPERKTAMPGLKGYNEKWDRLDPLSRDIPYPAPSLLAKDISSSKLIASVGGEKLKWTTEEKTIANVQAFFLLELGITPTYWECRGQTQMGISMATPPDKVERLKRQLKQERFRWHPDKLGVRTGEKEESKGSLHDDQMAKTVQLAVQRLYDLCLALETI